MIRAIPETFARDRLARGIEMSGYFRGRQFIGTFTEAQWRDVISDALYYASDVDEAPAAVIRSAKRLLENNWNGKVD